MLEVILKVASMTVSFLGTVVKAIELFHKFKHQKSNHTDQS